MIPFQSILEDLTSATFTYLFTVVVANGAEVVNDLVQSFYAVIVNFVCQK